ncbi:Peroxiredoxin [Spironucleus salmonicida]|uniref:Peroxiredoxin n=1 Tax=Spironucleus salmonicida TaxID=348837 RepID=V6LRX1_9EUKA|nr:Peroxiredoxin [Spironucleus salmonicida]|eukprot:EST47325.1 Peroxiredoxin [Spironucleus salmonicida]
MPIPLPGSHAPNFQIDVLTPTLSFEKRQLSDYKGKYLVIVFYPLDFAFVCPSEIIHFSEASAQLKIHTCDIIIGSCDSQYTHFAWSLQEQSEGGIGVCKCDIFADKSTKMSQDFGVLTEGQGKALRGIFIISDTGIVRSVTVNDFQVGRSVEECLRLVQAFQYADKTGAGVPCGWSPEKPDEVVKGTIEEKKEFYKRNFD